MRRALLAVLLGLLVVLLAVSCSLPFTSGPSSKSLGLLDLDPNASSGGILGSAVAEEIDATTASWATTRSSQTDLGTRLTLDDTHRPRTASPVQLN